MKRVSFADGLQAETGGSLVKFEGFGFQRFVLRVVRNAIENTVFRSIDWKAVRLKELAFWIHQGSRLVCMIHQFYSPSMTRLESGQVACWKVVHSSLALCLCQTNDLMMQVTSSCSSCLERTS